ncbi:hypothetical protein PRIPAC_93226 [Pristionchus pacificus]|nr:hypothetical protein PRIPAC_93226 [Pristionchus pacificus]
MGSNENIDREIRKCSRIRPFLYVAGIAGLSPGVLSRFGTVINLIPGFRLKTSPRLNVYHIAIDDDERVDLAPFWTTVFKAIDEERKKRGKLLLLCGMGISRSATFAIGYLMCIEKLTLHDAYKHVQHRRSVVCPNIGFFRQMIELEEKMFSRRTVNLIEPMKGIIVADVVWNELYDEMMEGMSEEERILLKRAKKSSPDPCPSPSSSSVSTTGSSSSNSALHLELDRLSLRST